MSNDLELEVWQRVAGLAQSPSHDFHHIRRVQAYAEGLGKVIGVDTDLVRLAAILHDLGRGDETRRHGLSSLEASKELAEQVLRHLDLSPDARKIVIEAIETHDQPDLNPASPAGRILKDADFLAGFGAWGVLRIAMWSGETGRRIEDAIKALTIGMQRRLEALEYAESRDSALREVVFARQFQGELERPVKVASVRHKGFYCIIEGTSGVGKNTIAKHISARLPSLGLAHRVVEEPSDTYRALRKAVPENQDFVPLRKALLMADRADQFARVIRPALEQGEIVLSVRSYLSTAVYQCADRSEAYRTLLEHDWLPVCDLLLLLDTDVPTALHRIATRTKAPGDFETPEHLSAHRLLYLELAASFPSRRTHVLDASRAEDVVVEEAFAIVQRELNLRYTP
jgi:dTMP kinase